MKTQRAMILLGVLFFTISGVSALKAEKTPAAPSDVREKLVDLEDCRLYFTWIPGHTGTILLEAGGGMDSQVWKTIMPKLAERTGATVIAYDRAGFGRSDLPDSPCRMDVEARWLHDGLAKLELGKALILVGHSYGGWMIRLYAASYPDQVEGMVFVDPFSAEFVDLMGVEYLDNHPMAGKLPFDASDPARLTKYQRALVRMVGEGLGPKMKLMRKAVLPRGIPIRLITSMRPFLPKPEEQQAWREAHRRIAAGNPDIILVEAKESGHMVPMTEPDLIIDQVVKVAELAAKQENR